MWILKRIKEKKLRLSSAREQIAQYLNTNCGVFSAQTLMKAMPSLDKVSVYRTIDMLVGLDIIHPVATNGDSKLFELHQPEEHHHHAICPSCNESTCVDCPIDSNQHHSLVFENRCKSCL